VIKSAVREPGDRAKIAVSSNEKDVDPVGACVGMKGSRVQSIIKELRGEKIDIIEWSDEPSVFAANALSPAKVSQVRITDIENRGMTVIVGEDQLSLAIGKKGQNVRLATRLVGWDIKIVSEEVLKKEIALQMGRMIASGEAVPITELEGVTPIQADALAEHGIEDIEKLAAASVDDLSEYLNVSMDEAEGILSSARAIVAAKETDREESTPDETAAESQEETEVAEIGEPVASEEGSELSADEENAVADDPTESAVEVAGENESDTSSAGDDSENTDVEESAA